MKTSRNRSLLLTNPACIAGVLTSRANLGPRCGRMKSQCQRGASTAAHSASAGGGGAQLSDEPHESEAAGSAVVYNDGGQHPAPVQAARDREPCMPDTRRQRES